MRFAVFILFCFSAANAATSCVDRCGDFDDADPPTSCQCNQPCELEGDCCSDYFDVCYACAGRCGEAYNGAMPCQCNSECGDFGNCCLDYSSECPGSQTLLDFTEELFTLDVNRKTLEYDPNPPGPLFTNKNPSEDLTGPTITPFINLRATYSADTCTTEVEDLTLRNTFLDAVFATSVMARTEEFFTQNDLLPGGYANLREAVEQIWYDYFDRCDTGSIDGSNGFEHSLIGEIDAGSVSGYHNWISWYIDESEGEIDYISLLGHVVISTDLSVIMVEMDWNGYNKPITSMWIGSSPEFELAMYTVCFYTAPNSLCDVSSNSVAYRIQTYDFNGPSLVGSAYPDI